MSQIFIQILKFSSDHLTYLPLDKMAAILADDNFKYFFEMKIIESNWQ